MRHWEKIAPVAAVISIFSAVACCLPLGIATPFGVAGLGIALAPLHPWLMGLAVVLLGAGLLRLNRSKGTCRRRSRTSIAVFWICAAIVGAMMLFPQVFAGFFADRLP